MPANRLPDDTVGKNNAAVGRKGDLIFLVPQHLREYAGLEREVTVAGVGPKIELWNSARFEANLIQTQARYEEITISLAAKLGS